MSPAFQIWTIVAAAILFLLLWSAFPPSAMSAASSPLLSDFGDSWLARLLVNLLGYSTVLVPGYLIKRYVSKIGFADGMGRGCTWKLVSACFYGSDHDRGLSLLNGAEKEAAATASRETTMTTAQKAGRLLFCFVGLQGSYLTWGILQEKIMTLEYKSADGGLEKFTDSQFLVFVNRILAFILSGAYLLLTRQPKHTAPLFKYSFCSFSNIMSSWCQYEALKYVSFPTQVLAKASKIIPVMIMGRLVSRRSYEYYEYVTAVLISVGMTMFMLSAAEGRDGGSTLTTFSGVLILSGYIAFDSFTSNWQGELFRSHCITSMQMMCGVNLFSCLFTAVSLLQQGGFVDSFYFALRHSKFLLDIVLLSLTSATGQLFIFHTISQFGAIVFTIMMTVRQGLAILLSVVIYGHALAATAILGVIVVFVSVFLRIYCGLRQKQLRARHPNVQADTNRV